MDKQRLEEIKARAAAATPGPWACTPLCDYLVISPVTGETNHDLLGSTDDLNDGALMAHARQDIPDLIAEIERLWAMQEQPNA